MKKRELVEVLTPHPPRVWGFTLIEIMVVVSIIGILVTLTLLGLQGSRESARDARRKSDIESVRAGLELYKADCKKYPTGNIFSLSTLKGDGSTTSCASANVYITNMPTDPVGGTARIYKYLSSPSGVTYELCASLERGKTALTCGGSTFCGSEECNYKATNP